MSFYLGSIIGSSGYTFSEIRKVKRFTDNQEGREKFQRLYFPFDLWRYVEIENLCHRTVNKRIFSRFSNGKSDLWT